MFKSTFSKYLAAFILIILVSFLLLSGLITSMIQSYVREDKENDLLSTSLAIASELSKKDGAEDGMELERLVISTLVRINTELEVIVTDKSGNVLLTTLSEANEPIAPGELGKVDMSLFNNKSAESGESYLVHHGKIGGVVDETHVACAKEIVCEGSIEGYVISLSSTVREDKLISITRRAVINSSAWGMLAAVIAGYFITERISHPLRSMTSAAKQFAKGNFETRITVYGEDEVSALGNAFNNMADSLDNLEKMRNSFLASVSHDLRTPMTTISGFIDGITSGAIPPEKHEHYLGVISGEVHRLSRLVSQLLDISRLESGDRKFTPTVFDVAEVGRLILISFEKKIDEKNLDVEFISDSDAMPVYADKDAVYQVMYNLCHNAIKFSKENGRFVIKITRYQTSKIRISVFDDGQVISDEDKPMIFERFYKSDKSRGLDKTGVGLGLYICKTIIDALGEEIHVESSEGFGTEFWFTLKEGELPKKRITEQ